MNNEFSLPLLANLEKLRAKVGLPALTLDERIDFIFSYGRGYIHYRIDQRFAHLKYKKIIECWMETSMVVFDTPGLPEMPAEIDESMVCYRSVRQDPRDFYDEVMAVAKYYEHVPLIKEGPHRSFAEFLESIRNEQHH